MCVMDRFCCCLLRTGSYVIGAFSIVVGLLNILLSTLVIHLHSSDEKGKKEMYIEGASIGIAILLILSAILLILGVKLRKKKMLLPWVIMAIINSVLQVIEIIMMVIVLVATSFKHKKAFGEICLGIAEIIILAYSISAIVSLYRNNCYEIGESQPEQKRMEEVHYDPVRAK